MANTRTLKSRNQREGRYVGRVRGSVLRMVNARGYLDDDMPRGEWGALSKKEVRRNLTECSRAWKQAIEQYERANYE